MSVNGVRKLSHLPVSGAPGPLSEYQAADPDVAGARITIPGPLPGVVERQRLFEQLDAGSGRPLTVVTGPPGAGKTVLVSDWTRHSQATGRVAWLSVERGDTRHPEQFWSAVAAAVRAAGVTDVDSARAQLTAGTERFATAFANAAGNLSEPLVLVLDDYHELGSTAVEEQVDALVRYAPAQLRLVVISRADPRLTLHRLRLEARIAEVRAADLAFTLEEARLMFALAGIELDSDLVSALHRRTEGWVAGLRLAALLLEGRQDPAALVSTFAGDEGSVADYLVEQVLRHQPPAIREFMLETSVVDMISAELADALTESADGAAVLARLERSGSFLSRIEGSPGWYRYHRLFAELLRSQFRHLRPESMRRQHRRAAHWYARRGSTDAAVGHAVAAEDWALASTLLAGGWLGLLVRGDFQSVSELVGTLPRSVVATDPELAVATGGALVEAGALEPGRDYLQQADDQASSVRPGRRTEFLLARTIAQMITARASGDQAGAIMAAKQLLAGKGSAALSLDVRDRRALVLLNLGIAETWAGASTRSRAVLEEALALARHAGREYIAFSALGALSLSQALDGALRRATQLGGEAIELADRYEWDQLPAAAAARCALGICAFHRDSLPEADRHLQAVEEIGGGVDRPVLVMTALMQALVALREGDEERAEMAIVSARQTTQAYGCPDRLVAALAAAEAMVMIGAGRPEDAEALLATHTNDERSGEIEVVRAQLALADGDPGRALAIAGEALMAGHGQNAAWAIELRALSAVAQHQSGDDDEALRLLDEALSLAEPEDFQSPFVAIGAPLRGLLARRIRAGTAHRPLAGRLSEALDPHTSAGEQHAGPLVLEPLSEREAAVLRFLPTTLSKAEIASELYVSVNTVKTHTKNIYRKLDVTDRAHAVRRARTLHLV